MKAAGIICEFNPFHNGHKYLFDNVRQDLNPDALVCVMSGNFVQRGEPAMWNKYIRAEAAVRCGADLVIELPVYAAVNSASEFAKGGISILNGLGVVNHLAFGSECGDVFLLNEIAQASVNEDEKFSAVFRTAMDEGMSYPRAYQKAVASRISGLSGEVFDGPNNILGIEYLKQMAISGSHLIPYTVRRIGSGHNEMASAEDYASGTYLRSIFNDRQNNYFVNYIPNESFKLISLSSYFDKAAEKNLFEMIRFRLLEATAEELSVLAEVSEGLENSLKKAVISAESTDDLVKRVKSKRYTYARISRILMQMLLGITKDSVREAEAHPYARVLAFNEKGREVIKAAKKEGEIPVITNLNSQVKDDAPIMAGLSIEFRASDIYSILNSKNIYENSDKVCNCILCNI